MSSILKRAFNQRYPLLHFSNFVRFRFPSANSDRFINSCSNWYQTVCSKQLLANSRTWNHLLGVCRSSCISHTCKYPPMMTMSTTREARQFRPQGACVKHLVLTKRQAASGNNRDLYFSSLYLVRAVDITEIFVERNYSARKPS